MKYQYQIKDKQEAANLINFARSLGVDSDFHKNLSPADRVKQFLGEGYSYLIFSVAGNRCSFGGNCKHYETSGPLASYIEICQVLLSFAASQIISVELDNNHIAKINKDSITIGDVKFSLDSFDKLAEAVKLTRP